MTRQLRFSYFDDEGKSDKVQKLLFVIHKHSATRLHYDFRIQIRSGMPSFAIPKGPSLDPKDKRLAIPTTIHRLEYREFEGVLPKGGYGAGPVMIWDTGYYLPFIEVERGARQLVSNLEEARDVVRKSLKEGYLELKLFGAKVNGIFTLKKWINDEKWLLIKSPDQYVVKNYDANRYDFSAVTKRSMKKIEEDSKNSLYFAS